MHVVEAWVHTMNSSRSVIRGCMRVGKSLAKACMAPVSTSVSCSPSRCLSSVMGVPLYHSIHSRKRQSALANTALQNTTPKSARAPRQPWAQLQPSYSIPVPLGLLLPPTFMLSISVLMLSESIGRSPM